jgi:hypothetical protein
MLEGATVYKPHLLFEALDEIVELVQRSEHIVVVTNVGLEQGEEATTNPHEPTLCQSLSRHFEVSLGKAIGHSKYEIHTLRGNKEL